MILQSIKVSKCVVYPGETSISADNDTREETTSREIPNEGNKETYIAFGTDVRHLVGHQCRDKEERNKDFV